MKLVNGLCAMSAPQAIDKKDFNAQIIDAKLRMNNLLVISRLKVSLILLTAPAPQEIITAESSTSIKKNYRIGGDKLLAPNVTTSNVINDINDCNVNVELLRVKTPISHAINDKNVYIAGYTLITSITSITKDTTSYVTKTRTVGGIILLKYVMIF
eukprot:403470_1